MDEINKVVLLLNSYLAFHPPGMSPRIVCNDGFSMSVQASIIHCCHPRGNQGPYSHVEIGFPKGRRPKHLWAYESLDHDEIYFYVPVELVAKEIIFHKGTKNLCE